MHSDDVLPLYVVCDESLSMLDHVDAVNEALHGLCHAVRAERVLADLVQLCLIGFAELPEVLLPLCPPAEAGALTTRITEAASNFGAVFTFLRETITRDVRSLVSRRRRVHRPAVLFLSDGQPTDPVTWPASFAALTDRTWPERPNVVAYGIGDVDPEIIGRVGVRGALHWRDGVSPAVALRGLLHDLSISGPLLADTMSAGNGFDEEGRWRFTRRGHLRRGTQAEHESDGEPGEKRADRDACRHGERADDFHENNGGPAGP